MIGEPERRQAVAGKMPRRATDIVEIAVAWVLGSAVLVLVVAAVMAAVFTYGHVAERAGTEAAEPTAATAVLLEPAPVVAVESGYQPPVATAARWTGPDGSSRTGLVPVQGPAPAGTEVPVWLDADGAVVDPPVTMLDAIMAAFFTGFGVMVGGTSLLVLGWLLVRRVTSRANDRRWEREWAAVGPLWSGRE